MPTTCDFSNKTFAPSPTKDCKPAPDCDASMGQLKCAYKPNPHIYVGTWMDNQLQELDDRVTNATPAGVHNWPKGCTDANTPSGNLGMLGGKCLWFNESAPHVKTDMFVVQGMPGVWDMHCTFEGGGAGIGQFPDLVSCSAHGNYFFTTYQCAQYQDHCLKTIMKFWEIPLQQQYHLRQINIENVFAKMLK